LNLKPGACTPPKLTLTEGVKPEPKMSTGSGDDSSPALGLTPVTLGTDDGTALSSTYSKTAEALATLDSPLLSVTLTVAGAAPSSGDGELFVKVVAAGGNTAASLVLLFTTKLCAFVVPTWTLFTFGLAELPNPDPWTVTEYPPAVEPEVGLSRLTDGGASCPA
jgi:hypothetical protein